MKQKKGLIFSVSLVLITLAALVSLLIAIAKIENQIDPARTIGERALELLRVNSEAAKLLFFIEESAKISAEKAIAQLQENGGLLNIIDCGVITQNSERYVYWNSPTDAGKKCFETNFYENYGVYFNRQLNYYLDLLATITKQEFPLNNYDLVVQDNKQLSGIALMPLQFVIFGLEEKFRLETWYGFKEEEIPQRAVASYAVKPSFSIPFKQDFSSLKPLKQFAQDVLDDYNGCKDRTMRDAVDCIHAFAGQHKITFKQQVQVQDNTFFFDVGGKLPLKFALFIPTKRDEPKTAEEKRKE